MRAAVRCLALAVALVFAGCDSAVTDPLEAPVAFSGECEGDIVPDWCDEGGGSGGGQTSAWPVRVNLYSNWSGTQARFTIVHSEAGWDGGYVEIGHEGVQIAYTGGSGRYAYAHNSGIVPDLCSLTDSNRVLHFTARTHIGHSTRQVSGSEFLSGCESGYDMHPFN